MNDLTLGEVWIVTAVLLGFQVVAFSWRIQRAIQMADKGEVTGLAISDYMVLASMAVNVAGVFVAPALGLMPDGAVARWLGLGILLYMLSLFVLAGHYNLYGTWRRQKIRPQVTAQELTALGFTLLAIALYLLLWQVRL